MSTAPPWQLGAQISLTYETFDSDDHSDFYAVLIFAAILAFVLGFLIKYVSKSFSAGDRTLTVTPQSPNAATQTTPQSVSQVRMGSRKTALRNELDEVKRALVHYQNHEDSLLKELMEAQREIKKLEDENQGFHYEVQTAENNLSVDVFTVPNGECYHVSSNCLRARSRNSGKMMKLRPCQSCTVRAG